MNGPDDPSEPEHLEGFSAWQEIGRGGDATVYRAIQDALQREVAIKALMVDDEESVRRFTREVQLMVSLGRQHPNIAKVLQIGTSSRGRPCIVMDYYELGSLDQRLAAYGQLAADEVVQVGTVVADALAFAHGKGVLHRDVKPQNILILPTSYVLADFGIARLIDSAHTASTDRFSYRHASPQVLEGAPPSEADDVFSLGATMFHLLDGKPPFTLLTDQPDSALAYIGRVRELPPRPLRRGDLPPGLVAIIDTALQKDPSARFRSAADLRDALADIRTEARAWSQGTPALPRVPVPPASQPSATGSHTWGGVPGRTHDTADLTSMRLPDLTGEPSRGYAHAAPAGGASARSAASATAPAEAYARADDDDERPRGMPLLAFALAGTTIGLVVGLVWWIVAVRGTSPGGAPPSPSPKSGMVVYNPNLVPRNVRLQDNKTTVDVSWDYPIVTPEQYAISSSIGRSGPATPAGKTNHPSRARNIPVDPAAHPVCVNVTGIKGNEMGTSQLVCVRE